MNSFDLKTLIRAIVEPPSAPLLVALVGLAMAWRGRRGGLAIALAGIAATWLLSTFAMGQSLMALVESGQRPFDAAAWEVARSGSSPPKAIVILGGGAVVDGPHEPRRERLAPRSLQRVAAGARVARLTGLPVLVSGGPAPWLHQSEANLMRGVLEAEHSVAVRWVEDASRDTSENATFSARMLAADGIRSVVLVTHAYHMPRSKALFESQGLVVHAAPHDWMSGPADPPRLGDFWPSAQASVLVWLALHETLGRAWHRLVEAL